MKSLSVLGENQDKTINERINETINNTGLTVAGGSLALDPPLVSLLMCIIYNVFLQAVDENGDSEAVGRAS